MVELLLLHLTIIIWFLLLYFYAIFCASSVIIGRIFFEYTAFSMHPCHCFMPSECQSYSRAHLLLSAVKCSVLSCCVNCRSLHVDSYRSFSFLCSMHRKPVKPKLHAFLFVLVVFLIILSHFNQVLIYIEANTLFIRLKLSFV